MFQKKGWSLNERFNIYANPFENSIYPFVTNSFIFWGSNGDGVSVLNQPPVTELKNHIVCILDFVNN